MDKTYSVLVVEDDVNISTLLIELLTSKDFKVTHIKDGKEVLETLSNDKFDLILLDEMLPSMNGSEILVRIKANPQIMHIPIIMMTSLNDDDLQITVLNEGADDYIQKPFRFNVLLARIEAVLRKSFANLPVNLEIPEGVNIKTISPKEKEILALIIKGYNNSKIAKELFITESTVSNHMQNIFSKLKVESRTQAAILALRLNVFS